MAELSAKKNKVLSKTEDATAAVSGHAGSSGSSNPIPTICQHKSPVRRAPYKESIDTCKKSVISNSIARKRGSVKFGRYSESNLRQIPTLPVLINPAVLINCLNRDQEILSLRPQYADPLCMNPDNFQFNFPHYEPYSGNFLMHLSGQAYPATQSYSCCSFSDPSLQQHSLSQIYFRRQESTSSYEQSTSPQRNVNISSKTMGISSGLRSWKYTNFGVKFEKNPGRYIGQVFTVMSYNVLAQELLTEHAYLYRNHNPRALLWEHRWKNILHEIKHHNPDILCLQEVQESHLESYYRKLNALGYGGIYKRRTGIRTDGCIMYYKKNVFQLIEHVTVEFNQPNISVLNRDNVAIIAKFAPLNNTKAEFVVATTHLLYNPRREDVRLAQTQVLFSEIDRISYTNRRNSNTYAPLIVTGDWNVKPNSSVYKFITDGHLKYENLEYRSLQSKTHFNATGKTLIPSYLRITDQCQHMDLLKYRSKNANISRKKELQLINLQHTERNNEVDQEKIPNNETLFASGTLSHKLLLKSVFKHQIGNDTEGTTFQDDWVTVDYIFYSGIKDEEKCKIKEDKLKLYALYSIPTTQQFQSTVKRIPNQYLGSDHIPVLAKFVLEY